MEREELIEVMNEAIARAQQESIDRLIKVVVVPIQLSVDEFKEQLCAFGAERELTSKQINHDLAELKNINARLHNVSSRFSDVGAVLDDLNETISNIRNSIIDSSEKVAIVSEGFKACMGDLQASSEKIVKNITKSVSKLKSQNVITRHPAELISVSELLSGDCSTLTVGSYQVLQKNSQYKIAELTKKIVNETKGSNASILKEISDFVRMKYDFVIS